MEPIVVANEQLVVLIREYGTQTIIYLLADPPGEFVQLLCTEETLMDLLNGIETYLQKKYGRPPSETVLDQIDSILDYLVSLEQEDMTPATERTKDMLGELVMHRHVSDG